MMLSHRSYLVQLIKLVAQIKSVAPLHRTGNKSLFVASYSHYFESLSMEIMSDSEIPFA